MDIRLDAGVHGVALWTVTHYADLGSSRTIFTPRSGLNFIALQGTSSKGSRDPK